MRTVSEYNTPENDTISASYSHKTNPVSQTSLKNQSMCLLICIYYGMLPIYYHYLPLSFTCVFCLATFIDLQGDDHCLFRYKIYFDKSYFHQQAILIFLILVFESGLEIRYVNSSAPKNSITLGQ
jgi:hypothetical protein